MAIMRVKSCRFGITSANDVTSSAAQGNSFQDGPPRVNGHPEAANAPESLKMRAMGRVVDGRTGENSFPEKYFRNILEI